MVKIGMYVLGGGVGAVILTFILGMGPCGPALVAILAILGASVASIGLIILVIGLIVRARETARG